MEPSPPPPPPPPDAAARRVNGSYRMTRSLSHRAFFFGGPFAGLVRCTAHAHAALNPGRWCWCWCWCWCWFGGAWCSLRLVWFWRRRVSRVDRGCLAFAVVASPTSLGGFRGLVYVRPSIVPPLFRLLVSCSAAQVRAYYYVCSTTYVFGNYGPGVGVNKM